MLVVRFTQRMGTIRCDRTTSPCCRARRRGPPSGRGHRRPGELYRAGFVDPGCIVDQVDRQRRRQRHAAVRLGRDRASIFARGQFGRSSGAILRNRADQAGGCKPELRKGPPWQTAIACWFRADTRHRNSGTGTWRDRGRFRPGSWRRRRRICLASGLNQSIVLGSTSFAGSDARYTRIFW